MATITSTQSGKWNETTTWVGGVVPGVGDKAIIEKDHIVTAEGNIDFGTSIRSTTNNATNASLEVYGTLKFSRTADTNFLMRGQAWITPRSSADQSTIDIGTVSDPIPENINILINVNPDNSYKLGYYYSFYFYYRNSNEFSKMYVKSSRERKRWTTMKAKANAGSTTIQVEDLTGWKVGDKLYLAPHYTQAHNAYQLREFEEANIQAIDTNTNTVTLTAPLQYSHGYDIENDKVAGVVQNLSSNIKFTSGGVDNIFYGLRFYRCEQNIQDTEFQYSNNLYNYVTAPLQIVYGGYYGDMVIKGLAFWLDSNRTKHSRSHIYLYSTSYVHLREIDNISIANIRVRSGYVPYDGLTTYYGGQNTQVKGVSVMAGNNRETNTSFNAYQQPSTFFNCVSVGATYSFNLHNNVDVNAKNCVSAGAYRVAQTYNGTAIYEDIKVRFVNYLNYMTGAWRGKSKWLRPDFEDRHLWTTLDNLVQYGGSLPDGNKIEYIDLQNDPAKYRVYFSYGQLWRENTETRNDIFSWGMYSKSDTFPVPFTKTMPAKNGQTILAGFYIKNLTSNYVGNLKVQLLQGSNLLKEENFDLTQLPTDSWSLLSISGTAVLDMDATLKIEYTGNTGKIVITDFDLPKTADQIAQAKAVWQELLTDNKVSGSFGESVGKTGKIVGWLRSLL